MLPLKHSGLSRKRERSGCFWPGTVEDVRSALAAEPKIDLCILDLKLGEEDAQPLIGGILHGRGIARACGHRISLRHARARCAVCCESPIKRTSSLKRSETPCSLQRIDAGNQRPSATFGTRSVRPLLPRRLMADISRLGVDGILALASRRIHDVVQPGRRSQIPLARKSAGDVVAAAGSRGDDRCRPAPGRSAAAHRRCDQERSPDDGTSRAGRSSWSSGTGRGNISSFTSRPRETIAGAITGVVGLLLDVTERRKRLAALEAIVRQSSHRSKNLLAVLQSLAVQTARAAASTEEFIEQFRGRIQSISRSQDLALGPSSQEVSLRSLIAAQVEPYVADPERQVRFEGSDCALTANARAARRLGAFGACDAAADGGARSGKAEVGYRSRRERGRPEVDPAGPPACD